jgi:glycosyltransferase involved in cell wall biosynthesis
MSVGPADKPLVSVIISSYNMAALIAETLESVLAQSHRPLEVIVVDDGSNDDIAQVVARFAPRVRFVGLQNSGGPSAPRNHGLGLARGQYVAFFDADDIMCADKIARQVDFLERHPQASCVLMNYRNFDTTGPAPQSHFETCVILRRQLAGARESVLNGDIATRILLEENYAITGSPLFRRSVFDRVPPFDEALLASEDFDLIYRVVRATGAGILDEIGFMRRLHGGNMSNRAEHILEYKISSRRKFLANEARPEVRRALHAAIAEHSLSLASLRAEAARPGAFGHLWAAIRNGYRVDKRLIKTAVHCAFAAVRGTANGRS